MNVSSAFKTLDDLVNGRVGYAKYFLDVFDQPYWLEVSFELPKS